MDHTKFIFPIAAYGGILQRQEYEVMIVDRERLVLKANDAVAVAFELNAISGFEWQMESRALPEMFQFLGLNFMRRNAPKVSFSAGGNRYSFYLELDARYRRHETIAMLRMLYRSGVPVKEQSAFGKCTFLLEPVDASEVPELLAALQAEP